MLKKNKKAFTLIELLVTIAIISVLAAFVIMNVRDARSKSKISKAKSDLQAIRVAIDQLGQDTGEYAGHLDMLDCTVKKGPKTYGGSRDIEFPLESRHAGLTQNDSTAPETFLCPDERYPTSIGVTPNCLVGQPLNRYPYPNWDGPYLATVPLDPWGRTYMADYDYICHPNMQGCENIDDNEPVCVIQSAGPDGIYNNYGPDDVVNVFCSKN